MKVKDSPIVPGFREFSGETTNSHFFGNSEKRVSEFKAGSTQASGFIPGYQGFIPCRPWSEESKAYVERSRMPDSSGVAELHAKKMPGYTGHKPGLT